MKFVASFSGGKDSVLALHEMAAAGHGPVALPVMHRPKARLNWVHGVGPQLLTAIGDVLEIPLLCRTPPSSDVPHMPPPGLL